MAISNRSGIQCSQHPNQQYSNYCTSLNCLKPLCPDCVEIHTKLHDKQQIESWKHCVTKQTNGLTSTLKTLQKIYQQQKKYRPYKTVEMVQNQNLKVLTQVKQKVHKLVDQIFFNYQQHLKSFIRKQYKVDLPDTTKLHLAIEEIRKLLLKFGHSGSILDSIRKSIQLDHQSLLKFFQNMRTRQYRPVNESFFIQNHELYSKFRTVIENSLPKLKQNVDNAQTKYQISSPNYNKNDSYSIDQRNLFEPLKITLNNYFNQNSKFKLLHFFIPSSNELKVLDIDAAEKGKNEWSSLVFGGGKTQLPCYFKSIITPDGSIYLTGGSQQQKRSNQIFQYNFQKNTLELVCKMKYQRSSHSICYSGGLIYLIGGFSNVQGDVTRSCQVFNPIQRKCYQISPLNAPSANSCATPFNDEYIFKFGGVQNKNQGNNLIQMYSIKKNKWIVVDIQSERNTPQLQLLSFSAAIQINANQLMIFGGYDNSQYQKPQRLCYTLQVNVNKGSVKVRNYNTTPLAFAEGFWNNNPVIHNGRVYALQNINDPQDQLTAIADQKRVIVFDGDRWY